MGDLLGPRHDDAEDIDLIHEAGHDRRLAGRVAGRDEAVGVHRRQAVVVGQELGQRRHVGLTAVGVAGDDAELLLAAGRQDPLGRLDAHGRRLGVGRPAEGGAGRDPLAQRLVIGGAGGDAHAAAVGDSAGHLAQDEAVIRRGREDAAAARLLDQGGVVGGGVEAEDRQFESVLPFRLAVAAGRVAAVAAQDRLHVVVEVEAARRRRVHDRHGDL